MLRRDQKGATLENISSAQQSNSTPISNRSVPDGTKLVSQAALAELRTRHQHSAIPMTFAKAMAQPEQTKLPREQ